MSNRKIIKDIHHIMLGLENTSITNKSYNTTVSYRTSMSLIKNLQQISLAVYMITDCVEDGEPLRNQARNAVLKSMESIANVLGNVQTNSSQFRIAHGQMVLLREHINILQIMGFVSDMNASILVAEIDRFIARLDTSILDTDSPHIGRVPLRNDMSFGIDLGELFYKQHPLPSSPLAGDGAEENLTLIKGEAGGGTVGISLGNLENQMGRLKRRSLILKLFRELPSPAGNKELTLHELVDKYSRYGGEGQISEKTIQRELLEMTADGTLEKLGTKRWVKYRLIHT